ncbi:sulfatase-like hydrolase/transferase [Prosthecobacter sp.]|uniref:sulfatase family protein n=1 Tax=Prosthecobacter sp. TaxID=1965333 RepID=UPI0024894E1A|nr:sulfatase-like hydrolase/transferase [Prosthecobacter sp.]MDI1315006.1 sulfatase-like hydrolase/transferase [Prosthecobacter sp.]
MKRLLVCCLYFGSLVVSANATDKPNIIVIYTDDHGFADLGIHGVEPDVKTPHLDALARSGVIAKHGYSSAPQCVPSRGGLITGKFQGRFNLDSNNSTLEGFNKEITIATRLQRSGYVTAQFGKWHLGPMAEIPTHGFTHSFAQHGQQKFTANITVEGKDQPMNEMRPEMYHIDGCAKAASSIIERYKEQPFFLYIAFRAPHTPLDAPQSYKDRFPGAMPERRRAALGMLAAVDDGVGLITSTLKNNGLSEKTLLFFIGDNGAPLKIHKTDSPLNGDAGGWDGSLNTPLNGEKGMLSEGGMHVPFLIAWPGTIPAGQSYEHPVSALDVAASAAAVADLSVKPGDLDGVNLVPYLKGSLSTPPHEALMWRWMAQSAIREGNWKLLRGGEREYLYDLDTDLEEKHNLASQHPDVAARLRTKLTAWCAELNPPGLALGPMAPVWNEYFDYYLDGKTAPKHEAEPTHGWLARGGSLIEKEGVLVLTPDKGGKGMFITRSQLKLAGPATATLTFKTAASGQGAIAWRVDGDKDFLPANRVPFEVKGSDDWQTHAVPIPAKGRVIHLRVHLPPGPAQFRTLDFKSASR